MAGRAIMALLLISVMITGTSNAMKTIELDDSAEIANANEYVKISTFFGFWGWGPPIKWWPISFCSWDYWTSAVWQVTLAGKFVTCNSPAARATGTALAGLGSRTIGRNARVQNILKGVRWNPLSTTPVLCAQRGGQMIFTLRLQMPTSAMNQLRSTAGTQAMKSVYSASSFRTLKLSGEAGNCLIILNDAMYVIQKHLKAV